MPQFAKLILLPLLVVFSLLVAPGAMSSSPQDHEQETNAHHNGVKHDFNGHEECATIACCLMPANAGCEMLLDRLAELFHPCPLLYQSGEAPGIPAPPPKPSV